MQETVYNMVKDKILEMLEESEKNGKLQWIKPWKNNCPLPKALLAPEDKFYSGCNILLLSPGEFVTMKQIRQMQEKNPDKGIKLLKGSKAQTVFYFNFMEKKNADGTPEKDEDGNIKKVPFLKFYKVFSIADVEGIESRMPYKEVEHNMDEAMKKAELYLKTYCETMGVELVIKKGMPQAYYDPSINRIVCPDKTQYQSIREYFSTVYHEICHQIDGQLQLSKEHRQEQQNNKAHLDPYSDGELLAEIGSAIICNMLYISDDSTMRNSTEYIRGWSNKLKEEKSSYIVSVSGKAWKAAQYFMDVVQMELLKQEAKDQEELVVKAEDKYIHVWVNSDGDFEYDMYKFDVVYNKLKQIDGGILEVGQDIQNMYDALADILDGYNISDKNMEAINVDDFMEVINGDTKYQKWEETR